MNPSSSASSSDPASPVDQWLAAEPELAIADEIHALRERYEVSMSRAMRLEQILEYVIRFDERARDCCGRVKPLLLEAARPTPAELYTVASELIGVLVDIASGYRQIADMAWEGEGEEHDQVGDLLTARALELLRDAYLVGCLTASNAPYGLWHQAHALWLAAERGAFARGDDPARSYTGHAYKHLLALACSQPEGLAARELLWLDTYLGPLAGQARLGTPEELQANESAVFWLDAAQDLAPVPLALRDEPRGELLLYFTASPLVRRVGEHLEWLRARMGPDSALGGDAAEASVSGGHPELPDGLALMEQISLLRRLRERWMRPPRRVQKRRPNQYSVQVCVGIPAIWDMRTRGEQGARIVQCEVVNDSDGGYGIVNEGGALSALEPGVPIALRHDPQHPWVLCIARWIRAGRPGCVELGLQVVSHSSTPVRIAFRGAEESGGLIHALAFAPMAGIRRHHAILAPAGSVSGRKFTVLHEGDRVYVAEAHMLQMEVQTACCEIFQYQVDPYSE